jgi:Carboxypeptidase regulatory-like domain/TonB dependent receptor-like, beta-barrel
MVRPQTTNYRGSIICLALSLAALVLVLLLPARSQDGTTSLEGLVEDLSGARIAGADVALANSENGYRVTAKTDGEGRFRFAMLTPGAYAATVSAPGMATATQSGLKLHVGGSFQLQFRLRPEGRAEIVTVVAPPPIRDPESGEVSQIIDHQAIVDLPLNGRRYTDLALLLPGVTQDPRGLTSGSNGDLSYGGTRGYQNSYLVDGADDNNSFFAQARGRYRAPYQFSNEVIKEFRVSSNGYSAELGRAGGAVFNVVTNSGGNRWHGTGFLYTRDRTFDAQSAYVTSQPYEKQRQFGGTLSGPLVKNRVFLYLGYDQHQLTVPAIVQFGNGADSVVPQPADYDYLDHDLVFGAAAQLNAMAGEYPVQMGGNAGFAKVDFNLSSKHLLFFRLSTSRYSGTNNVFFDSASPITHYTEDNNGTEDVATESLAASWTSAWSSRLTTNLRAQFSHDGQQSYSNSDTAKAKIYGLLDGMGRSGILPRQTQERKVHVAETVSYNTGRMNWKFGGDFLQAWIYNYYPAGFGGTFYFNNVKVNPWFFTPQKYGDPLTPLRAYAHGVPRYYAQDFGDAESHPNSRSYAAFVQNTIRVTRALTVNAGLRYDLQTFEVPGLVNNPLYSPSGKVPTDGNNFSPRVGFTYSIGERHPIVIRGGFGLFYSQIPAMYASQVETDSGLTQTHLYLDIMKPADAAIFPKYPDALVNCPPGAKICTAPESIASHLTTQISAFSPNFRTPHTTQASATVEYALTPKLSLSTSYLYVHGENLIRSLDANLPKPKITDYPVYDDQSVFTGQYYSVESFATWQTTRSVDCPYPPCLNDVQRPDPRLGTINSFESAASSIYNGMTVLLKGQISKQFFIRAGYTFAKAIDDGADSLVVGRPGNVQNAYATQLERGLSVTDQRQRFVASTVYEPASFHYPSRALGAILNNWKASTVFTMGSGRPINATMAGDSNRDDNAYNDRLPGAVRNAYIGPGYFTIDMRLSKSFQLSERVRLTLLAESFNVANRVNQRVDITDDGFLNSAGQFVAYSTAVGKTLYPGEFIKNSKFLIPTNSYAPRQVQFSLRASF